jgi:hypothetical protein
MELPMTLQLTCTNPKGASRVVNVEEHRPLRVRLRCDGHDTEVVFTRDEAGWAFINEGDGDSLVNGVPCLYSLLTDGAAVEVAGHRFLVTAGAPADDEDEDLAQDTASFGLRCSGCDGDWTEVGVEGSWQDGDHRLCAGCLARGLRPQHLSSWRHNLEVGLDDEDDDEQAAIETASISDELESIPERSESQSPSASRSRRRISASQPLVVQNPDNGERRGGIMRKVTRVFMRRGESAEQQRLVELEAQRDQLLAKAGRAALMNQGGLGLPASFLPDLLRGQPVTLSLSQVDRPTLEGFQHMVQDLVHVETEINALRQALGMGDAIISQDQLPQLRTERLQQEQDLFQTMDGMHTEALEDLIDDDDDFEMPPSPAAALGPPGPEEQAETARSDSDPGDKEDSGRRRSRSGPTPNVSGRRRSRRRR